MLQLSFNHIILKAEFFMKDYLKQNVSWALQSLKPNNPESSVKKCQHCGEFFYSKNWRNPVWCILTISILTNFCWISEVIWQQQYYQACILTRCESSEILVLTLNLTCLWDSCSSTPTDFSNANFQAELKLDTLASLDSKHERMVTSLCWPIFSTL